jgi:hypothetical protein
VRAPAQCFGEVSRGFPESRSPEMDLPAVEVHQLKIRIQRERVIVVGEGRLDVPLFLEGIPSIAVRLRQFRGERDDPGIVADGSVVLMQGVVRQAAVIERLEVVGLKAQGFVEIGDFPAVVPEVVPSPCPVHVGQRAAGVQSYGLVEIRNGLLVVRLVHPHDASVVPPEKEGWRQAHRLIAIEQRAVLIALSNEHAAPIGVRLAELRI